MLGPSKMRVKVEEETATYGRFVIEPLDQGFGNTLGNSLRRVLLSAIGGAAVTQVKIDGVSHQFTTITGVAEDVVEIILNIKKIRLHLDEHGPYRLKLEAKGPGPITAGDIVCPSGVEVVNKDLVLANLADAKTKVSMELTAEQGVGYALADEHKTNEIGIIPVDALFSPVTLVNYAVDPTRVGRMSNFDKVTLEISTDGTVAPQAALMTAAKILEDHFHAVVEPVISDSDEEVETGTSQPQAGHAVMNMSIEELDLPSRVSTRLQEHGIKTVADLMGTAKDELLSMKSFGKKSYDTVAEKLHELGVDL